MRKLKWFPSGAVSEEQKVAAGAAVVQAQKFREEVAHKVGWAAGEIGEMSFWSPEGGKTRSVSGIDRRRGKANALAWRRLLLGEPT